MGRVPEVRYEGGVEVTDEERLRVAGELRKLKVGERGITNLNHGVTWSLVAIVLPDFCERSHETVLQDFIDRLAELIGPKQSMFPYESKEWHSWYEGLYHSGFSGPSRIRDVIEDIVWSTLTIDLGPNGNVCSGIDEGQVLTDGLFDMWERDIREIIDQDPERTCHIEKYPPGSEIYFETCSVCGCILSANWPGDRHCRTADYCPKCGAKVVE